MAGHSPRYGEVPPRRSASSPESPLEPEFPAPRRTAESVPTPPRFTGPRRSAVSPESPDKTTVFRRITAPIPRRSAASPFSPDEEPAGWRNVPRDEAGDGEDDEHSTDETPATQPHHQPPPIPRFVKVAGVIAAVVLLVVAGWIGLTLGKPSPEASPTCELKLPVQVGDFVAGEAKESPAPDGKSSIIRATYSDGNTKFVLLFQRPGPASNLDSYLGEVGISDISQVHDASCGIFVDSKNPVCARVLDSTAIMVMGLSNQDNESLAGLIDTVYATVKKQ